MKAYPRWFLPSLVASFVALALSGFLLVPTALEFRLGFDVVWRLPGEQRLWVAAAHSALSLTMCAFVGALWSVHMRVGWRSRRHLVSGLSTVTVLIGAALTAIGLLYFGNETSLLSASVLHTLIGTVSVAASGMHWAVTIIERSRKRVGAQHARYAGPARDPRPSTPLLTH